ncbi:MAG TPA: hypothetical protein VFO46_25380 [Candidatus Sulfotelmatobacter sp.]|nr:hypothetical protein [Candidatus Sulfotelmatobacter sp.]
MERASHSLSAGTQRKQRGRFGVFGLILCLIAVYAVVVVLNPWAFHIGERWTPLLYWTGTGKLVTKSGTYPMMVTLFPASHFSRLHLDGLRPTGGIQGNALLCTSRGVTQYLDLSGTIYGGWRSTDGALMDFRLLERRTARDALVGTNDRGFFDLYGYWHGPQLRMDDRGEWSERFRSGLRVEHASMTLEWGRNADFNAACASMASLAPGR